MGRRLPNPYRRSPPQREPYDTVLIACEGSKTEPYYFQQLAADYRLSPNVKVVSPGADPVTIVKFAKNQLDDYQRVFCVFDAESPERCKQAMEIVRSSQAGIDGKLQAIVSSPCFEVWLLLHFELVTRPFSGSGGRTVAENVTKALIAKLPSYSKGDPKTYSGVRTKLSDALSNAQKLHRHNVANRSNNPATDVHLLVDYLRKIRER